MEPNKFVLLILARKIRSRGAPGSQSRNRGGGLRSELRVITLFKSETE